ncbi:uncharacterized protein LOC142231901 [Haematobia irritans]|uniref:uncharacterized protein LOC142231901 n=1 Tax=Haematobia irritans TaxID=7368 RepID=UPI003F4F5DB7
MIEDIKLPNTSHNGHNSPTHSKSPSISSSTTTEACRKRLESLADEEIIQNNLKELMDKKNREERKANGRLVAVILASLVIFCAIYQAWIRKSGLLARILVPAGIMLSFAAWVVVLAKRDKAKRALFEKYLEEVALKNKQELEAKKTHKAHRKTNDRRQSSNETVLEYINEINRKELSSETSIELTKTSRPLKTKDHRKHRKHRNLDGLNESTLAPSSYLTSPSSSRNTSHYAHKDLRIKRPSIRQKLFRQTGHYHMAAATAAANSTNTLMQAVINSTPPPSKSGAIVMLAPKTQALPVDMKRKRLQRLDALKVPTMVRMGSAP